MIDSQFEQQKRLPSPAPQSNVRFRKRQWSHYQLQYVGTDITVGIINVVEMLFSQISRHFQQPGKPGSLVKRQILSILPSIDKVPTISFRVINEFPHLQTVHVFHR